MEVIQPSHVQYEWSVVRKEDVEVSKFYDGFLYLIGDSGFWIQSNDVDRVSLVRSLELNLRDYKGDRTGDFIGELSQLTHLSVRGGDYFKYLPKNTSSRLHNRHHFEFFHSLKLEELAEKLGDLYNLTSFSLQYCPHLKSVPNSVTKLSNLITLFISHCYKLEELPANLGDLYNLTSLFLVRCYRLKSLPWSITKLSKLQFLFLPWEFRVETLSPHLNDFIIISVDHTHVRKTWKDLKIEVTETLSFQFPIIPEEEELALKTSTFGYLQSTGDLTPWILDNYDLNSVRILDLDLSRNGHLLDIPDSMLPRLTHFYVDSGCLQRRLPPIFTRLAHLSLIHCTFECDTDSHFDSLGNLSTLTSLHLEEKKYREFPKDMDLPISIRHLSLSYFSNSIPDSYVEGNLNTLTLTFCDDLESLPLNLSITKLILRETRVKSLPIGLKHLEIIHYMDKCSEESCNKLQECLNQLINLETLSYTCYEIESFSSVTSLHNLRELQLKDCFSLKELPQDLDKLVKLCILDVSGTRIQSLPNSIMNLHNLQRLILPKCFILKTLSFDFENKVTISVDDTDEIYYKHQGYYDSELEISDDEETSDDEDSINPNSIEDVTETPIGSRQGPIIEHEIQILEGSHFNGSTDPTTNNNPNAFISSPIQNFLTSKEAGTIPFVVDVSANTMQDHDPIEFEGFHFTGGTNAFGESNHHALCSLQNQETGTLTLVDRNCIVTSMRSVHDIAAGTSTSINLHEAISFSENCQEAFHHVQLDNINLEMEQRIAPCSSLNSVDTGSNYRNLENDQDENARHGKVKNKKQKIEIPLESIQVPLHQDLRLMDAANQLNVGETENLQSNNWDGVGTDIAAEQSSNLHETNLSGENIRQAFQSGGVDHINLELEQGTSSSDSPNFVHGKSNNHALVKMRNKNPQRVSKSTMKRRKNEHGITIWPSSRKRKNPDTNRNETHSTCGRNLSRLNQVDPSYLATNSQGVEHLPGPSQHTLSYRVASEHNVVNDSTPDVVTRTVRELPLSTEYCMDSHQRVEEHPNDGAREPADLPPNERSRTFDLKANNSQSGGLRKKIPLEWIVELMSKGWTLIAAAKKLGVSRATLKRRLKDLGLTWQSNRKKKNPQKNRNETHFTCGRNLSQLNSGDASNAASHCQIVEDLAGQSHSTFSYHVPSEHNVVNNSILDVVTRTIKEPPLSTQYCMDSHQHVEEHPNGAKEPAMVKVNTDLPPNERSSTFVVKATFKEDTARFNFSLSSSIEKLKDVVSKKLELEVGTFKIKYKDIDNDLVLMNDTSDLEDAVSLSRKSGSDVVRLSISLKT